MVDSGADLAVFSVVGLFAGQEAPAFAVRDERVLASMMTRMFAEYR
ncbi:hypothetical protein JQK87_33000 [Streptomyces sp. G44]|nr:hypothetical protein [Streptomyces sp. G44]MBM7173126.1 hypothetical protein [Streptomyces sp. G44]